MLLNLLIALTALVITPSALAQSPGENAPEIIGKTLGGSLFKLSTQRGHRVVLNFFSVNCIPCRAEMPELAELAKHYPKVRFVSVHVEDIDDEVVAAWVKKLPAAPPTIVLAGLRVQQNYKTDKRGLPETHLINEQGKIIETLNGHTPKTMGVLKAWLGK